MREIISATPDIVDIKFIGHSNEFRIAIGSGNKRDTNISASYTDLNGVLPGAIDWGNLTLEATIEIWGCHAGRGRGSVAQVLATESGARVIAPDSYLNFDEYTGRPFFNEARFWEGHNWLTFEPERRPKDIYAWPNERDWRTSSGWEQYMYPSSAPGLERYIFGKPW